MTRLQHQNFKILKIRVIARNSKHYPAAATSAEWLATPLSWHAWCTLLCQIPAWSV